MYVSVVLICDIIHTQLTRIQPIKFCCDTFSPHMSSSRIHLRLGKDIWAHLFPPCNFSTAADTKMKPWLLHPIWCHIRTIWRGIKQQELQCRCSGSCCSVTLLSCCNCKGVANLIKKINDEKQRDEQRDQKKKVKKPCKKFIARKSSNYPSEPTSLV